MHRGNDDYQPPWLYQFLLNASADEAKDCLEPKRVKVIKALDGPYEDGSVRKQISDGELFMDALFSLEAFKLGILVDDSQVDWDCCDLLLKGYRLRYEIPSINQNCVGQMVLVVTACCLVTLSHGMTLKEPPSYCMSRPELQKKLQRYRHNLQPAAEGSCLAESCLGLSLLMAQMSDDIAAHTQSQPAHKLGWFTTPWEPPDLQKFLISDEDQQRLEAIEEWLSDYRPVEETPTHPSTSCSEIAIQSDLSYQVHRQSPTILPKTLCDASVQVTMCLHEPGARPATADVGVEVGDSLMFNTQPVADQSRTNKTPESITDQARAEESSLGNLPVAVPLSVPPPPILAPCIRDFPQREEMWSSDSSLRLSCDEEPNDLRPDPNLEMLGQRLASSDSSENRTFDDESQPNIPAYKVTTPSSPQIIINPRPFKRFIHLEESTRDPVTTNLLHCSDPERLDPVIRTGTNLQCIQSTQIGYLSSQHCPFEPDFPLSPVMRSSELDPSTQSFDPFVCETAPVDSAEILLSVGNFPCVGNIPHSGTVSRVCETVSTGGNFPDSESVPISAYDPNGGNVPGGGYIPEGENVPCNEIFSNVETVAESRKVLKVDSVQNGQSGRISCSGGSVDWSSLPDMLSFGSAARECGARDCGIGDEWRVLNAVERISSIGRVVGHIWLSPGIQPGQRAALNEMEESETAEKFEGNKTGNSCAVERFGVSMVSQSRAVGKLGENMVGESCAVERFGENMVGESMAVGKFRENIVGEIWVVDKLGENMVGERRAVEKLGDTRTGESRVAKTKAIESPTGGKSRDPMDGEREISNHVKADNVRKDVRTESRAVIVRTEDVRECEAMKNDDHVVRAKGARTELNMLPCQTQIPYRRLNPASMSVPPPLSVSKQTISVNLSVSASVTNQDAPAIVSVCNQLASVSVANRQDSGVSKQTTTVRVSVTDHLTTTSLSVSRPTSASTPSTGPALQLVAARSDLRTNHTTLATSSLAHDSIFLPVSVTDTTSSASVSVGCSKTIPTNNDPKSRTKSSCPPGIVAHTKGEVPGMAKLGCTSTYPFPTLKPTEEGEEEMDSFDELLILSAESTRLHAEVEPSESSVLNVVVPVENSVRKPPATIVSMREKAARGTDDVATNEKMQKSVEKKNKKSLIRVKGSRLSLSRTRDPTALFIRRDLRKLPDNRKRKLFNVDQVLERLSSGNQTDSDSSNNTMGKKRRAIPDIPGGNRLKGKSKETQSRKEVDAIVRVTIGQSSDSNKSGNNDVVADGPSGLKILSRDIAKEPNCSEREQTKKSKKGETKVMDSAPDQEQLIRTVVELVHTQRDSSELQHSNHTTTHLAKDRVAAAACAGSVQLIPLGFGEGNRVHNRKTGKPQSYSDGNYRLADDRSWSVAKDKLRAGKSLSTGNRQSSVDMFTGLTSKPSDPEIPEDTVSSRFTRDVARKDTESHDKSDTRSCRKDIGIRVDTKSRDSSAKNNPVSDNLKNPASNRDIKRDEGRGTARATTSRNREIIENSGSCSGGVSSKSGVSQTSLPERLTLPTPKNSLPSHQPQRQTISRDGDLPSPVNGERLSPKFNRDRIKMLIGRDRMTADAAKAFSGSNLPENLKRWTFDYFKKWS